MMKVLLAAPLFPGNIWQYVADAFTQLNIEVELFDYRSHTYGKNYYGNSSHSIFGRVINKANRYWNSHRMNRVFIDRVLNGKPDIVLVIKGELFLPKTIHFLRQNSQSKLVLWFPDSSTFLGPQSNVPNIVNSLSLYELVLFCDPDHIPVNLLKQINSYRMLTFGCHPPVHRTVMLTEYEMQEYGSDICFIGNSHFKGSIRDRTIEAILANGFNLRCWGLNWPNTTLFKRYPNNFAGPVYGETMVKIYNASEIILNINGDYPYLNVRNFEAPACGTCTITSAIKDLDKYFIPGQEVVVFESIPDLINKLDYYLSDNKARKNIAIAGQKRAHRDHSLQKRMAELLELIQF